MPVVPISADEIRFSSGRTAYAHRLMFSLNARMEVGYGADGDLDWPPTWPQFQSDNSLTAEDMRELADYMIALWARFKESLDKQEPPHGA